MELEINQNLKEYLREFFNIENSHYSNLNATEIEYSKVKENIEKETQDKEAALNDQIQDLRKKVSQCKNDIVLYPVHVDWSPVTPNKYPVEEAGSARQIFEYSLHQTQKRIGLLIAVSLDIKNI